MSATSPGFIERDQWKTFLEEFSKRNQSRSTRVEVVGLEVGAQEEEAFLPLIGISLDTKGSAASSVEITLGNETSADPRRVELLIENVQKIAPLIGTKVVEEGLGLEDKDGNRTLLLFEHLTELPERT